MKIGVIIPTRNMADTLWNALRSCKEADQIVVIDDASDDGTQEVVGFWSKRLPVSYIRHEEKLADHNLAQRPVYEAMDVDYVIGLGADDVLFPNCITAIRAAAMIHKPAVIFTGVDVLYGGWAYQHTDHSALKGFQKPEAVRGHFRNMAENATESGIGSAMRRDVAVSLWGIGWGNLGPFMDSVGYGTVACLHGAYYVHERCAALAFREESYGRIERDEEYLFEMAGRCVQFMLDAGLDKETISAICEKRCSAKVKF